MHITVAGKSVDTGDALRFHVEQGLNTIASKYFDHALEARVVFSRNRGQFLCDINMHAGRNITMQAEGSAPDAHRAFEAAAEHLGKRLRRYRRRVNEHARGKAHLRDPDAATPARQATLRRPAEPALDDEAEAREAAAHAMVVAERPESVMHLTVGQAALRLETAAAPVLLFRNSASGVINVVYRRQDGHVGWLDPGQA
jgi:ribosomal subunit interface protein